LHSRREGGQLKLEVRDNGVGLPPGRELEEGVGLSNTRARLKQLYFDRHRFELAEEPGGGLAVFLELPFHARGGSSKDGRV
jgi:signal transduction histidine kinase